MTKIRRNDEWLRYALHRLNAEANRTAGTNLLRFPLPADWGIELYLKDESTHPTGSLKHRLARSLFRRAVIDGDISAGTTIVEASSGSTAVSEAYFARLLGLEFVAVVPATTSLAKRRLIERYGGRSELIEDASSVYTAAEELGSQPGWHYLDQFSRATAVTDWASSDALGPGILSQMRLEDHPVPQWIVVGAGTGGTSASLGRYLRQAEHTTRLAVVDPENSVFYDAWCTRRTDLTAPPSRIEGIGRPRVEPSFLPGVIDEMVKVPDAASIAGAHLLYARTGIRAGASTGTNLAGTLTLVADMLTAGQTGSIVTLICDRGDRYLDTVYDPAWCAEMSLDPSAYRKSMEDLLSGSRYAPA